MGRPFRTFTVLPHLPERLQPLQKLAYNLWWCWHHEAVALFRRVDAERFEEVEHSPVKLLGALDQGRLDQLLADDGFLAHMDRVEEAFDAYMSSPAWYDETFVPRTRRAGHALPDDFRVAYFSAEFGLHESVPVYSGGLGVLSGDHLKSASDLGLPLVGVGLMYREGYFRQYLTVDGWQQERYPENDFFNLPLVPVGRPGDKETGRQGEEEGGAISLSPCLPLSLSSSQLVITVPFPGRDVHVRIWRLQVGRVPLYLLDTNIPPNTPEDRGITGR